MPREFYRPTWIEVDLEAIRHNIIQFKQILPEHTEIIAAVKANAYGHGSIRVAEVALQAGAKGLVVALLEEAVALREAGITAPILVLGWVDPAFAAIASKHDISLTFFQAEWLDQVTSQTLPNPLQIHMKWDTGMGRIGVRTEDEIITITEKLKTCQNIRLSGIFTHFASADADELEFYQLQLERFQRFHTLFKQLWPHPIQVHVGNSAAATRFPDWMHNYIRLGISMYGLYPSLSVKQEERIQLEPAFSLHSKLVHVKQVPAGESISYGNSYITEEQQWIGTVPIGYGDGWSRKMQGFRVLVNGRFMPIVGRVCMDQMIVRLDQAYPVGTQVTLIGEQKNQRIEMDDVAAHLDTINYEVACMINKRIPRVYR